MKLMCVNMLYISCTLEQITLSEIFFFPSLPSRMKRLSDIVNEMHNSDLIFMLKAKNHIKTLVRQTIKHPSTIHVINQLHEFVSLFSLVQRWKFNI